MVRPSLPGVCGPAVVAVLMSVAAGCGGASTAANTTAAQPGTTDTSLPAIFALFTNGVTVTKDGDYVVIRTKDLPDHKTPYYDTANPLYTAYNGSNASFKINPNRIAEQQLSFRIPIAPSRLSSASPTPLGPIGVAFNGVALFNQYAGPNQPLTGEIDSFDQYNGHPQQTGQYHYHVEPVWLTSSSKGAIVGILLDGYPVYGPVENGKTLTSADLDALHGHTGATKEYPNGIYHYHTTADAPYINGTGFAGSPGTCVFR